MKNLVNYSLNQAFFEIGNSLMRVFGIVYFYTMSGNNFYVALGIHALSNCFNTVFLFFLPKYIGRMGTRTALIISRIVFFLTAIPIFFLNQTNYLEMLFIWSLLYGLAKSFLFIPNHILVLNITKTHNRGKSVGIILAISSLLGIIAPLIAGIVSNNYGTVGYSILLAICFIISIFFLRGVPDFRFTYTGDLRKTLKLKNILREIKYSAMANFQDQYQAWQIYVFQILKSSFSSLGYLTTGINLIGALLNFFLGKFLDSHNRKEMLRLSGFLQSSAWLMRMLINTPIGALVSDSYMKLTSQTFGETLTVFSYDLITVRKHDILLDEKIIAREIILTFVNIFTIAFAMLIFYFFGFTGIFILAMLAALSFVVI